MATEPTLTGPDQRVGDGILAIPAAREAEAAGHAARAHLAELLESVARQIRTGEIDVERETSLQDPQVIVRAVLFAIGGSRRSEP